MGPSLNGSWGRAVLVASLVGLLAIGVSQAAARPVAPGPTAHSACRPYLPSRPNSPCKVGNILLECGFAFGACESSKYMKCKLGKEEGTIVHFPLPEGLEGTRLENRHKKAICKGSATVLRAYFWEARERTTVYQSADVHPGHSLSVTLYYRQHGFRDDGLVIFAQH